MEDLMLPHKERRLLRHEFTLDELEDEVRRSREAELVRYRSQCGLLDIDGMDSTTLRLMFRFHKHDFKDLCSALLVPREITTAQNVRLCRREALCVLLQRLAYPNRYLEGIFGRHFLCHVKCYFASHGPHPEHLRTSADRLEQPRVDIACFTEGIRRRIFRESGVYTKLERLTGNEDFVVYGDPAYPLRPLLMKPYGASHLSPAQQAFNCGMSAVLAMFLS
ncbi:hypothetical protein MTO96_043248 [Rhipicephalus appendiculatus]